MDSNRESKAIISRLSNPNRSKVCTFYDDLGGHNRLRLTVNNNSFPNIHSLKSELSRRIEVLPQGVKRIFTPRCQTEIKSLENLRNEGHYLCTSLTRPRNRKLLETLATNSQTSLTRKTSGSLKRSITSTRDGNYDDDVLPRETKIAWGSGLRRSEGKEILLFLNGKPEKNISIVLGSSWNMSVVIRKASRSFQVQIARLLTSDGNEIKSMSQLLQGLQPFIAQTKDYSKDFKNTSKRKFVESKNIRKPSKHAFRVIIKTGSLPSAGTSGKVQLTIYGETGNSGRNVFRGGEAFQSGKTDEFLIHTEDIGRPFKVRIELEPGDGTDGWFCDEVRLVDIANPRETLVFPCGRWLSIHDDDWQLFKELPLLVNGVPVFPAVTYEVSVKTGDVWNGGTNGKVFVTLHGVNGDSGRRGLIASIGKELFSRNQLDEFSLELVWLGDINRVDLSLEEVERQGGGGWFVDYVAVKCRYPTKTDWTFPCFKWVSGMNCDGRTERRLTMKNKSFDDFLKLEMFKLHRWKFKTGNVIQIYTSAHSDMTSPLPEVSAENFIVHAKGANLIQLQSSETKLFLTVRGNELTYEERQDGNCDLSTQAQSDQSFQFQSVTNLSYLTIKKNGLVALSRKSSRSTKIQVYCKGTFKSGNVVAFDTSVVQSVSVDNMVTGLGSREDISSYWVVHKIRKGIYSFESQLHKNQFLSVDRQQLFVDISGSKGDPNTCFRIHKMKLQGYVTLESKVHPGVMLGVSTGGTMAGMKEAERIRNIVLYPRVVKFKEMQSKSNQLTAFLSPVLINSRRVGRETGWSGKSNSSKYVPSISRHQSIDLIDDDVSKDGERTDGDDDDDDDDKDDEDDDDDDDDSIEREAVDDEGVGSDDEISHVQSSKGKQSEWRVAVATEESLADADVCLYVCGSQGSFGPVVLGGPEGHLFVAGNVDEFKVNIPSRIGSISKLRLELQSRESVLRGSWKVDTVKLRHVTTGVTLKFKFQRWLSRSKEDGDLVRELPVLLPHLPFNPVVVYVLSISTGRQEGAETNGNVFLNLFGNRGSTGNRLLYKSNNEVKYLRGQMDIFKMEAVYLGRLKFLIIAHSTSDHVTSGGSWFCEQILVSFKSPGNSACMENVVFPCHEWLTHGPGERKFKKILRPRKIWRPSKIPVFMKSTLSLNAGNEPKISKNIRSNMEATNLKRTLSVSQLSNFGGKGETRLPFSDQSRNTTIPLVRLKSLETFSDVTTYQVQIHAGFEFGDCLTRGRLFVVLKGKAGDSGRRSLKGSTECNEGRSLLRRGTVETFLVESIDLDDLKEILLGFDNDDDDDDAVGDDDDDDQRWFLERIVVRLRKVEHEKMWTFTYGKFLVRKRDNPIVESLTPLSDKDLWKVYIRNGARGSDGGGVRYPGDVFFSFTICGEGANSARNCIKSWKDEKVDDSEHGCNEFLLHLSERFGFIYKMRFHLECNSSKNCHWCIEKIILEHLNSNKKYFFEFNDELYRNEHNDGCTELPTKYTMNGWVDGSGDVIPVDLLEVVSYEVLFSISDGKEYFLENKEMLIKIIGFKGDSGVRELKRFRKQEAIGEPDGISFVVSRVVDLMELEKVVIYLAEEGNIFLEKLEVKKCPEEDAVRYVANCKCRLQEPAYKREYNFSLVKKEVIDQSEDLIEEDGWLLYLFLTNLPNVAMETGDELKGVISATFRRAVLYSIHQSLFPLKLEDLKLVCLTTWTSGPIAKFKLIGEEFPTELLKIRIGFEEITKSQLNHLSLYKAFIKRTSADLSYEFSNNDDDNMSSLSSSMKDGWLELPAKFRGSSFHGNETSLIEIHSCVTGVPVLQYLVIIRTDVTRNRFTPGLTAGQVFFVDIHGHNGNTGVRKLFPESSDLSEMTFQVYAVDLSTLSGILIGHFAGQEAVDESVAVVEETVAAVSGVAENSGCRCFLIDVVVSCWTPTGSKMNSLHFRHNGWIEPSKDGNYSQLLHPEVDGVNDNLIPTFDSLPAIPDEWKGTMRTGKFYDSDDDDDDDDNKNNNNNCSILYIDEYPRKPADYKQLPIYKSYPEPLKGDLLMVLYDVIGCTEVIQVQMTSERPLDFEPDEEIEFKILVPRIIEQPYKIRIGASGETTENWILGNVAIEDPTNGNVYKFEFEERLVCDDLLDGWIEASLSEFEGSGSSEECMKTRIPSILYNVFIHTGLRDGPSRDLKVSLNLIGQRGDTGIRRLGVPVHRSTELPLFQTAEVDHFQIEAVDLINIHEISIHARCSERCDWLINKVIVNWDDPGGHQECEFFVNSLLKFEENADYLKKSFELKYYKPDTWKLHLEYKNARRRGGGGKTDGSVDDDDVAIGGDDDDDANEKRVHPLKEIQLVVYGDRGWSKEMKLFASLDRFDGHSRVEYQFENTFYPTMGNFYKVRIGIPDEVVGPARHEIGKIFMRNESQERTFIFQVNGCVEKNVSNDGWKEAPAVPFLGDDVGGLETAHVEACLSGTCRVLTYGVQVQTGNAQNSSTDDVIFVEIFGTKGSSGRRKLLENLSGNSKKFVRGQLDVFLLEAVDLHRLERIHLGRMNRGNGGWLVDMVTVVVPGDNTLVTNYKFNCSCWISKEDPVKEFLLTETSETTEGRS